MAAFLKVLQCVLLDILPTGDVGTAEASPNRLRSVADHTVPFLRVEDGMALSELQLLNVLAPVHC